MFSLIFVYFACWANYARSWYEWLTMPDDGVDEINDIFDWFYAIEDPPAPTNDEMVLILKPGEDMPTNFVPRNKIPAGAVECTGYMAIVTREEYKGPVQVLMLRHNATSKWAGSLDIPGGGVSEKDGPGVEGMKKAARRELMEECGLDPGPNFPSATILLHPEKHKTKAYNLVEVMFVNKTMVPLPKKEDLEPKFECAQWINISEAIAVSERNLQTPDIRAKNDVPIILRAVLRSS